MPLLKINLPPAQHGRFERQLRDQLRLEQQRALQRWGREAVSILQRESAGIRDLGGFQQGWRFRAAFNRADVWNGSPHAQNVERGRRAGAPMPPIAVIASWAARKLGQPGLGFVIARAIARKGIKKRPVLNKPSVRRRLIDLAAKLATKAWDAAAKSAV